MEQKLIRIIVVTLALAALGGCSDDSSPGPLDASPDSALDATVWRDGAPGEAGPADASLADAEEPDAYVPPSIEGTNVDLLVLVDNSMSMAPAQELLRNQFSAFLAALRDGLGGMPNLHVGVVTSTLGAGRYTSIPSCVRLGGDKGILGQAGENNRGEQYIGPGQRYIVDVAPVGCTISRDGETCTQHDCTEDNCAQAVTPGSSETLHLATDAASGCPRCRNYNGDLSGVFADYAFVGEQGCGFEQQLEATRKALDPQDPDASGPNAGFLRDDSFLLVLYVTDEDDCSAEEADTIFNPDPNMDNINSPLGPLSSFRCFEFGITCDINDRTVPGARHDCVPRDASDPSNYLFPIDRYTAFLEALRDPARLLVAAIAGPVDDVVYVAFDSMGRPTVDASCELPASQIQAKPAIRILSMLAYFNDQQSLDDFAFTSICTGDFTPTLRALGRALADKILGR